MPESFYIEPNSSSHKWYFLSSPTVVGFVFLSAASRSLVTIVFSLHACEELLLPCKFKISKYIQICGHLYINSLSLDGIKKCVLLQFSMTGNGVEIENCYSYDLILSDHRNNFMHLNTDFNYIPFSSVSKEERTFLIILIAASLHAIFRSLPVYPSVIWKY